jgi:hypothetical protein
LRFQLGADWASWNFGSKSAFSFSCPPALETFVSPRGVASRYFKLDLNFLLSLLLLTCFTAAARPVEIQVELDKEKFNRMFVRLMTASTPAP